MNLHLVSYAIMDVYWKLVSIILEDQKRALNTDIITEDYETTFKWPLGQKITYNQQNNIAN